MAFDNFPDNGTYTLFGRILDKDSGYSDYSMTVDVYNVAPTAVITNTGPVAAGSALSVSLIPILTIHRPSIPPPVSITALPPHRPNLRLAMWRRGRRLRPASLSIGEVLTRFMAAYSTRTAATGITPQWLGFMMM